MEVPEARAGLRGAAQHSYVAARYDIGVRVMVKERDARCSTGIMTREVLRRGIEFYRF